MKKSITNFLKVAMLVISLSIFNVIPVSANSGLTQNEIMSVFKRQDNIASLRIAVPTKTMIRKADREIHWNMYNDNMTAHQIIFSAISVQKADSILNNQFESAYRIDAAFLQVLQADDAINILFAAEQIQFNNFLQISKGDIAVTLSFQSEN